MLDHVQLTRQLRFGLHESAEPSIPASANGFAANPALLDLAPFLTLAATIAGRVDPATGMLLNIKTVDRILRQVAIPILRAGCYLHKAGATSLILRLFTRLAGEFTPHRLVALRLALSPFLSLTVTAKEPAMVQLTERFEFSAAHRLHADALSATQNREIFGRCNNPNGHGHNYELEVTVAGEPDPATGQVISIPDLQRIVNQHAIDLFDHKHLNLDCPDFRRLNPTVENIARVLYEHLQPAIPAPARLATVRVWETPKTMCEYGRAT